MIVPFSLLLVACLSLSFPRPAQGIERAGDAAFADSYRQHARSAVALEGEALFQIQIAPDEERFDLYRAYNQFVGTWLLVELLQAELAESAEQDSSAEEEEKRAALRDEAQFVLLTLEQTESDLERSIPALERPDHLRMNQAIGRLLFEAGTTLRRWLSEQCARVGCATVP